MKVRENTRSNTATMTITISKELYCLMREASLLCNPMLYPDAWELNLNEVKNLLNLGCQCVKVWKGDVNVKDIKASRHKVTESIAMAKAFEGKSLGNVLPESGGDGKPAGSDSEGSNIGSMEDDKLPSKPARRQRSRQHKA